MTRDVVLALMGSIRAQLAAVEAYLREEAPDDSTGPGPSAEGPCAHLDRREVRTMGSAGFWVCPACDAEGELS